MERVHILNVRAASTSLSEELTLVYGGSEHLITHISATTLKAVSLDPVKTSAQFYEKVLPEWLLLLPIWLSDWLWLTGAISWQLWIGDSRPEGAELDGFSMFFSSISSWWIHRSGGRRSF